MGEAGAGPGGKRLEGKRLGLLWGRPVPGSASLSPSPRPHQQPARPAAGPEKPVNINVLLEPTGPTRGPEVSVALPTAERGPSDMLVLPKGLYFGFPHTDK